MQTFKPNPTTRNYNQRTPKPPQTNSHQCKRRLPTQITAYKLYYINPTLSPNPEAPTITPYREVNHNENYAPTGPENTLQHQSHKAPITPKVQTPPLPLYYINPAPNPNPAAPRKNPQIPKATLKKPRITQP